MSGRTTTVADSCAAPPTSTSRIGRRRRAPRSWPRRPRRARRRVRRRQPACRAGWGRRAARPTRRRRPCRGAGCAAGPWAAGILPIRRLFAGCPWSQTKATAPISIGLIARLPRATPRRRRAESPARRIGSGTGAACPGRTSGCLAERPLEGRAGVQQRDLVVGAEDTMSPGRRSARTCGRRRAGRSRTARAGPTAPHLRLGEDHRAGDRHMCGIHVAASSRGTRGLRTTDARAPTSGWKPWRQR